MVIEWAGRPCRHRSRHFHIRPAQDVKEGSHEPGNTKELLCHVSYRGEDYRDIPLLTEREVWLRKSILDEDGKPVVGEDGIELKEVVKVMPAQIRDAIERNRSEYLESLSARARSARDGSERLGRGAAQRASSRMSREDIPF